MTQLSMKTCESLTMTGVLKQIFFKKDGRVTKLCLQREEGICEIKASKYFRVGRDYTPSRNDFVELKVLKKMKAGRVKLKAFAIAPCASRSKKAPKKKISKKSCRPQQIAICQSSKCKKQGAQKLWTKLEKDLVQAGRQGQVQLTASKCLGQCKKGPAAKLPSGKVHNRLNAATVMGLLS